MTARIKSTSRLTKEEHLDLVKRIPNMNGNGNGSGSGIVKFTSGKFLTITFKGVDKREIFYIYESDRRNFYNLIS